MARSPCAGSPGVWNSTLDRGRVEVVGQVGEPGQGGADGGGERVLHVFGADGGGAVGGGGKLAGAYVGAGPLARSSPMSMIPLAGRLPLPPAVLLGALVLSACASEPAPDASMAETETHSAGASFTLATDSLVVRDSVLRYAVAIGYPQIRGSAGEPMSATLRAVNAAIRDSVRALAEDFRPEAPPAGDGSPVYPVDVEGAVGRSFVSNDVLSVLVSVYAFTGGAHGTTFFLPLTYDLRTGRALAPADLFAPGTPWPDTLAAWTERAVVAELARRLRTTPDSARANFFAGGLDSVRQDDVAVTMGRDSLRVHVPPYQLSAYSAGSFDVGVPYPVVRPFARPGSVLALRAAR